jgi:hypothetical protein
MIRRRGVQQCCEHASSRLSKSIGEGLNGLEAVRGKQNFCPRTWSYTPTDSPTESRPVVTLVTVKCGCGRNAQHGASLKSRFAQARTCEPHGECEADARRPLLARSFFRVSEIATMGKAGQESAHGTANHTVVHGRRWSCCAVCGSLAFLRRQRSEIGPRMARPCPFDGLPTSVGGFARSIARSHALARGRTGAPAGEGRSRQSTNPRLFLSYGLDREGRGLQHKDASWPTNNSNTST